MGNFIEVTLMVLWACVCLVCLFVVPVWLFEEEDSVLLSLVEFVGAVIMTVGWFFTAFSGMDWAASTVPTDGCYHLYTHDVGIWIKGVYYPNSETEYIPIHCTDS